MTAVPTGESSTVNKRAAGKWFIGVQDAGLATASEFSMRIEAHYPYHDGDHRFCDRFGRYDCSNTMWKVPPDLDDTTDDGWQSRPRAARAPPWQSLSRRARERALRVLYRARPKCGRHYT